MEQNKKLQVEEQDMEREENENYIGHWGRKRENYLKNYKKSVYKEFKTSGYLQEHLRDIDRDADRMEDFLVSRMAELEGVNEELKQADQMGWVGAMNNIVYRAREIVDSELIFT